MLRSDFGARRQAPGARRPAAAGVLHGAAAVAGQALMFANPNAVPHPALVNRAAGVVVTVGGWPIAVMAFGVTGGRVVEINAIADPERVGRIAAGVIGAGSRSRLRMYQ